METQQLDIQIKRGTDFILRLLFDQESGAPLDLTGATASAKLRESLTSTPVDFTVTITEAAEGKLELRLPAATSADLTTGKWIWDLALTLTDGTIWSPLEGVAVIRGGATYG